jgi:predicted dehydrogenase
MVSGGVIGDPVHVESFYGYKLAGPFGAALLGDGSHWVHKLPGKLFHNTIDHMLYKITEFIDDEKPCIKALAYSLREGRFGDERDDVQDELRVMIQGSRVSAYGTFSGHIHPAAHFVRVCGTKNTLHIDYVSRTVILEPDARLPSAIGRLLPAFGQARRYLRAGMKNTMRFARSDFHFFAGLNNLIAAYYDSILNDTAVPISYRDILRISAMLDEIFAQIDPGAHLK